MLSGVSNCSSLCTRVCAVQGLSKAVKQVLLPIMKSIKDDLNSVKRELTSLNKTVSHLSGDLEQHKNQTASVLADLQSSINRSSERLRDTLVNQLDDLDSKLNTTSELMRGDLRCVKREMTSLNESVNRICDKMEEHEDHMTTEIMELEEHLQRNFTNQQENILNHIGSLPVYTCNGTGGWRRAVYLDMTDPNTNCPEGWNMTDYYKRTCGRPNDGHRTCDSVTFSVSGGEYSQVCGRMRAYQWGWTAGFYGSYQGYNTVDEPYFDGVAVMHGNPRQHIWTFAAGGGENYSIPNDRGQCACDGAPTNLRYIPPFVGEDYFCEAGYIHPGHWNRFGQLHSNDTLWDGRDCHSSSTCCSLHNPPYFVKTLNTSTTDDIELRMCIYFRMDYTNLAVELVELYVK